jgi:hypothetical protein
LDNIIVDLNSHYAISLELFELIDQTEIEITAEIYTKALSIIDILSCLDFSDEEAILILMTEDNNFFYLVSYLVFQKAICKSIDQRIIQLLREPLLESKLTTHDPVAMEMLNLNFPRVNN